MTKQNHFQFCLVIAFRMPTYLKYKYFGKTMNNSETCDEKNHLRENESERERKKLYRLSL